MKARNVLERAFGQAKWLLHDQKVSAFRHPQAIFEKWFTVPLINVPPELGKQLPVTGLWGILGQKCSPAFWCVFARSIQWGAATLPVVFGLGDFWGFSETHAFFPKPWAEKCRPNFRWVRGSVADVLSRATFFASTLRCGVKKSNLKVAPNPWPLTLLNFPNFIFFFKLNFNNISATT